MQSLFNNNYDKLISALKQFDVILSEKQLSQFESYYELLTEWNSFMNLTAITDFEEVLIKHFTDSISLIKAVDLKENDYRLMDVGTGAGFPGIPLKIVFPELDIVLLDSLSKRVKFLNEVILQLDLKNIIAVHGRAEDFAKNPEYRESFDLCVSRAVANLSTLSEYCIPFVKVNGRFVSYKSENLTKTFLTVKGKEYSEMEAAKKAISILGGTLREQIEFELPDTDIYRNLVVIDKIKETPKKYPRKAGLPSREPLS
jgi:16S rRNA (guanine527-N7)-methyltransferase